MSELTELRKEIAGLFSGLAKSKNALRKIEARVAKALPAEKGPDVYKEIEEWYGKPFSELQGPFKSDFGGWYVPMMADGLPVFKCASPGFGMQEYLTTGGTVACGYSSRRYIILRPAKKIVFVEDPKGRFRELLDGGMLDDGADDGTRYRREGTP